MTESQKHREFVESKWFHCQAMQDWGGHPDAWGILLVPCKTSVYLFASEDEAWQAAHDFTIAHLEAIRQIEEEMQIVARDVHNKSSWSRSLIKRGLADKARKIAIQGCRSARTLARLEVWRDEMKRGMRV